MTRFILAFLLVRVISLHAQSVPSLTTYQGRLTDASGNPVADGSGYEVEMRLWPTATGGTIPIWASRYSNTVVKNGALNVILGSPFGTPISGATTTDIKAAFAAPNVFIAMTVTKGATGTPIANPTEILPRQQWMSAPFAFRAEVAVGTLPGAVTSNMIADGAVAAADIADGAITNPKLAANSVNGVSIAANVITSSHIAGGSIDPDRLNPKFAILSEQLASSTAPQAAVIGWQKRKLNTVEQNIGGVVTFDDNTDQFTLSPGTFEIEALVPYYSTWSVFGSYGCRHRSALRRVSDSSYIAPTTVYFSDQSGSNYSSGSTGGAMQLHAIITVSSGSEAFELMHHLQDTSGRSPTGTVGQAPSFGACGVPAGIAGVSEVYSRIIIKRIK